MAHHYERRTGVHGQGRIRAVRAIQRLLIIVVILCILIAITGVIYTWYTGLHSDKKVSTPAVSSAMGSTLKKPPQIDPNAAVGVYIQTQTSPVVPGSNTAISVKTTPDAECTIRVEYNHIASKDSGLNTKFADEYGIVSWSWTVSNDVPLGKWPVDVTCALGKKSGYVRGDLVIVKQLSEN